MAKATQTKHRDNTEASRARTTGSVLRFKPDDKEILVKIVRIAQACNVKGSKGDWNEFLQSRDEALSLRSDPKKKSWDVLASFVNTFINEEDIQMVMRLMKWNKHCKLRELLIINSLWPDCPEQELVRLTYEHPLFWKYYTFASYHEDWLVTKLGKLSKETNPDRMIAIDCEMVRCEDGTEEVVKVCVVDRNLETLIDTLVKPSKPVADYLTPITGVKAEDLEGVTCSLRDMQVVLGHDFREEGKPHICLDDAIFAMKVTLAKLDRRLDDALGMDSVDVSEADASKLYIHNIPHNVFVEELQTLFPEKYAVEIQEFSNKKYRRHTTFAIFKDPKEADEAFESLRGELEMDWNGLPQKAVSFYKAMTVHVRKMKAVNIDTTDSKMSNYNDNVAPFTMKRPNKSMDTVAHMATDEEALQHGKRRKAKEMIEPMTNCMKECNDCIHLKEQERLMKELEEKDAEIRNLQKLVSALTRNHCL